MASLLSIAAASVGNLWNLGCLGNLGSGGSIMPSFCAGMVWVSRESRERRWFSLVFVLRKRYRDALV